jgi:hypothetical protein
MLVSVQAAWTGVAASAPTNSLFTISSPVCVGKKNMNPMRVMVYVAAYLSWTRTTLPPPHIVDATTSTEISDHASCEHGIWNIASRICNSLIVWVVCSRQPHQSFRFVQGGHPPIVEECCRSKNRGSWSTCRTDGMSPTLLGMPGQWIRIAS